MGFRLRSARVCSPLPKFPFPKVIQAPRVAASLLVDVKKRRTYTSNLVRKVLRSPNQQT